MFRIFPILLIFSIFFSNINYSFQMLPEEEYSLNFNKSNWNFDSTNGVYYQRGVVYCKKPINIDYQSLWVYVPKEYLSCNEQSGLYNCEVNTSGKKGPYNSTNAPIVLPVDTPGYAAMKAPTSYDYTKVSEFIQKGIIFIYAGCRGRYDADTNFTSGAPWAVTDLKSAIRYIRYNKILIPGDKDKIYTFGMSGGGAQSCLLGVTGNSELYKKYLEANGAALKDSEGNDIKDNVKGSQCWCPITNLDTADAAYEWNIGQYYSEGTRKEGNFTKLLSDDLTSEFVSYINNISLKDLKGNILNLTNTNEGTYYDYLKSIIEESLSNFFEDTTFPYTPDRRPFTQPPGPDPEPEVTYQNISDYINKKNADYEWLFYDEKIRNATIKSVGDFVKHCKSARKNVAAFDDLNRNQGENKVFGTSPDDKLKHFDQIIYSLLIKNKAKYSEKPDYKEEYPNEYLNDFDDKDSVGNDVLTRLNMYNPMFYLIDYYEGFNTSDVADYFRINTGLFQSDTGNVVEMNLYLALKNFGKNVDFTTVWEKEHVEAERKGSSKTNFIAWIAEIENAKEDDGKDTSLSYFLNSIFMTYLLSIFILI